MKKLIINIFKTFLFFDLSLIIIDKLPVISGKNTALVFLKNTLLSFFVVAVLSLIFVLAVEKNKFKISFKKSFKKIYQGAICGVFLPAIGTLAAFVFKKVSFGKFSLPDGLIFWLIALLLWSVMTEILLRGYLFTLYKKHYGFTVSAIVTTLLSLSLDITLFSHSKLYIANMILFNIMLCFILEHTGSVIAIVSARFVFFLLNTVLLGFAYPLDGYPSLLQPIFSGNKLLNGGEYGILGSILTLVILSLVTAYSIYKRYNVLENSRKLIKNSKLLIRDAKRLFADLKEKIKNRVKA